MKDQILISKGNGASCVGIPLFRLDHSEELAKLEGQSLCLMDKKPIAWIIDIDVAAPLMNGEFVEQNFEIVGDL